MNYKELIVFFVFIIFFAGSIALVIYQSNHEIQMKEKFCQENGMVYYSASSCSDGINSFPFEWCSKDLICNENNCFCWVKFYGEKEE